MHREFDNRDLFIGTMVPEGRFHDLKCYDEGHSVLVCEFVEDHP